MRSWISRRTSPATMVAVIALVFAMAGGAYAAKRYVITSTNQISPKVLKALAGKAAPKGASGAAGAQGAAGVQGPGGAQGASGSQGSAGPKGEQGERGSEGPRGLKGEPGQTGFTDKLPSGKTETGTWTVGAFGLSKPANVVASISFPIPLATGGEAVLLNEAETEAGAGTSGCTGTLAAPTAPKGKLCIYTWFEDNEQLSFAPEVKTPEGESTFQTSGSYILFAVNAGGHANASGVWAVTAP